MTSPTTEIDLNDLVTALEKHLGEGAFDEASRLCEQYKISDHYIIDFYLAKIAFLQHDRAACIEHLKEVACKDCDNLFYLGETGNMLMVYGMYEQARLCYEDALEQYPGNFAMMTNIGITYKNEGRYFEALDYLLQAEQVEQNHTVYFELGSVYSALNQFEKARDCFSKAVEHEDGNILSLSGLAYAYRDLGEKDKAIALFEQLLAFNPNIPLIHYELSLMCKYEPEEGKTHIKQIVELITNTKLNEKDQIWAYFTLGKIYDDSGDVEHALEYCAKANALEAKLYPYDIEAAQSAMLRNQTLYTKSITTKTMQKGDDSHAPVFVLGMPRSGSTLTEKILTSHSAISTIGESDAMDRVVRSIAPIKMDYASEELCYYPECAPFLSKEQMEKLAHIYLQQLEPLTGTYQRIVDKALHNFTKIGLIVNLFPNASIIHCKRHPLDCAISMYMLHFHDRNMGYTRSFETIAQFYKGYNAMMKHWHSILPGRIYDNYYEKLVTGQEECSRRLIAHVGLAWEEQCLDFYKQKAKAFTASTWQVTEKIYTRSMFRYKKYEGFIEPLKELLANEIQEYEHELTQLRILEYNAC